MVYEAERLIDRRFGRARTRRRLIAASYIGTALFGVAAALVAVLLIRKI